MRSVAGVGLGLLLAAGPGVVAAEEARTPIRAALLLSILATPAMPREVGPDALLKADLPAPRARWDGVVQPDGTVRYGDLTVTVKNPCPPGAAHYGPPPLPGRRARN